jgi:methionyl-tRNA formyltransferase
MEEKTKRSHGISGGAFNLIFMGTPDFAVPSLQKLVDFGANVPLVVTQPDRPKGRGKKIARSPVKVLAEKVGLPVYQPERVRSPEVIERICSYGADCLVVAAYGQILPGALLDGHPLGALNVHASLLPRHRGAAPIQRAILAGEAVTGVSIMLLDTGMDTGPVLSRRELPIGEKDSFGSVHDKMSLLGAELLLETLIMWRSGSISLQPQDDALATYAPPIKKEELRISWSLPAREIVNAIRAFDPVPGAFAFFRGKRMKLFAAALQPWKGEGKPGEIIGDSEEGLVVLGGDGHALSIAEMQIEGQRRLSAGDLLRGHPMDPGSQIE